VPGWLCEYGTASSRPRQVWCKFREGYSDLRCWPRIPGTIRPSCHPAAPLATEGRITIASPDGKPNLRKKGSNGGKDREPLQLGEASDHVFGGHRLLAHPGCRGLRAYDHAAVIVHLAFEKQQRDALAMVFLTLHDYEFVIGMIFWGLWLFPSSQQVIPYQSYEEPKAVSFEVPGQVGTQCFAP